MGKALRYLWLVSKWTIYTLFLIGVIIAHGNFLWGVQVHRGTMVNRHPSPQLSMYADQKAPTISDRRLSRVTLSNATASYLTYDGWETYQRRIVFDVSRARATSGRGLTEKKLRSESQMYHLRQAIEIGAGYLKEQTSPENLLKDMLAAQAGLGPIATLQETRETSQVMFAIQDRMQRAMNESVEDVITSIEGGATKKLGRVTPFRYSPTAYRALAYYRYAARYGSKYTRQKAVQHVEELRSGLTIFKVEEASTTFEFVAWSKKEGGLRLITTDATGSGIEHPEQFKGRVYYTDNITQWREVFFYHAVVGRSRFLRGGDHYAHPLEQSGTRVSVTYDRFQYPPPQPRHAVITVLELNESSHRKLTRMRKIAQQTEIKQYKKRLKQAYGRLYWEPTGKPTFHRADLKRAYHRYEYLQALLEAGQAYHPNAYSNRSGVYLDSKTRISGIRKLESEFDSAQAYRAHIRTQQRKLEATLKSMNQKSTTAILLRRYQRYLKKTPLLVGIEVIVALIIIIPPTLSVYRLAKRIA